MFRLRALRRACRKHSFVFNPLAARLVQHGGDKARVYFSFEQDFFFLPIVPCRQLADPGKGRWEAGIPLVCVSLGESFHPPSVQTQMLMLSKAATCLFVCIKAVTGNPQAWAHPEQSTVPEPSAVVFTNTMSHVLTQICPILHTQEVWSASRKWRHSERPVLSPAGASTDWGLVVRPPHWKGAVALGVSVWAAASPACVHLAPCIRTGGHQDHKMRLDEHP